MTTPAPTLPTDNQEWPPRAQAPVAAQIGVWDSWYSGDADRLSSMYGGDLAGDPARPLGGWWDTAPAWRRWLGQTAAKFFWGTKTPEGEKRAKIHLPMARDIARTSAGLLFAEPPTMAVPTKALQKRLDKIASRGMLAGLTEAAELSGGLGGTYLRIVWDKKLRGHAWLNGVNADAAIPEWRWDALAAVTFWRETRCEGNDVWRHLEYHTPGWVLHGLYKGGRTELGTRVGLDQDPATAGLNPNTPTGATGLTACYIPNMRPAPMWRSVPAAQNLGRADFDGTEGLMDSLDLVYSSLIRDIRLGVGRIHVPSTYLQSGGPGQGATFIDRELYAPVHVMGGGLDAGLQIEATQLEIRVTEHLAASIDLMQRITSSSGYSTQTFGLIGDTAPVTATEVTARERASFTTRGLKTRNYWTPELEAILPTLLEVDAHVFGTKLATDEVTVEFGAGVRDDPVTVAQSLNLLAQAEAASIETRVRMLNPDWDDTKVNQEVQRIRDDQGMITAPLGDGIGNPNAPTPPADPNQPPQPGQ